MRPPTIFTSVWIALSIRHDTIPRDVPLDLALFGINRSPLVRVQCWKTDIVGCRDYVLPKLWLSFTSHNFP
jgi:hypothetical protein